MNHSIKSTPFLFLCETALQAAILFTGGCSGEKPQPPFLGEDSAGVSLPSVVTLISAAAEAPGIQEPPVVEEIPAEEIPAEIVPANVLEWDSLKQSCEVNDGKGPVLFSFRMTNVSEESVVVEKVNASCGCTTVNTRTTPFSLPPGASENLQVSMSVDGKFGTVTKSLLVQGSRASWTLLVTAELPPAEVAPGPGVAMSARSRSRNIGLARADRQAVFKGDCAGCHADYAEEQYGYDLYLGACAICHDAEHRASMVPDLRVAGMPRDAAYWRQHITHGLDTTLMPAFALEQGGILSNEQIDSLVESLVENPLEPQPAGH
jgi:mono/diheme cytochrome c family protein